MKKSGIAVAVLLLMAALSGTAQQQGPPRQPESPDVIRPDAAGFRLHSLSTQASGYSLEYPGATSPGANSSLWYVAGGALANAGWLYPGRQTRVSLNYEVGYNRNQEYDTLNGFDHAVTFRVRRSADRRTSYEFGANFESRLVATAIFQPSRIQQTSETALNQDELAAGLASGGESPFRAISPLDLVLSGARITMGSATVGFTHSQTPKLSWVGNAGVSQIMRADSTDERVRAQYPAATVGTTNLGGNYLLSSRTRIAFIGNWMHVHSARYALDWEFGAVDIQRSIGRRSFAHLEAGYGRIIDQGVGTSQARNAYTVATGAGTIKGNHTLLATFRRGGADYRGLGLDTSLGCEVAWAWAAPGAVWSTTTSGAFERLSGYRTGFAGVSGNIDALVARVTVTRRLTPHTRLVIEGAYVDTASPAPLLLNGGGFRVAYIWTPAFERRRRS